MLERLRLVLCDAEMSDSSAVDNPVPTVSDSVEMPESSGCSCQY